MNHEQPPSRLRAQRVRRIASQVLPLLLGVLIIFIALRDELPTAVGALFRAHPAALACLLAFFVWNHVATLAWRALLRGAGVSREAPLAELVRLRIEAQAINQIVPSAGLAGEALRASRAGGEGDLSAASVATALDNIAGAISGFAFAGLALAARYDAHASSDLMKLAGFSLLALVVSLLAAGVPFWLAPRWLPRFKPSSMLGKLLAPFTAQHGPLRRAFRKAIALRFAERVLSVSETYIAFQATGTTISLADAALINAVFVLVTLAVFFLPGQLGAAEVAAETSSVLLGLPASAGTSAALVRRARQLVVCVVGIAFLLLRRLRRTPRTHEPEGA